jgi:hypothetical protein
LAIAETAFKNKPPRGQTVKFLPQLIKFLSLAVICSWLSFFPAYTHYYNLTEADCFRGAHIENPVLSDHLASLEKKWNGAICSDRSTTSTAIFLIFVTTPEILSSIEKFSPLRC